MSLEKYLAKKMNRDAHKPLYQMTRAEYQEKHGKPRKNTTVTGGFDAHKDAVETAMNKGDYVTDEILSDYPEFKRPRT